MSLVMLVQVTPLSEVMKTPGCTEPAVPVVHR
jgi:hypothetical protein